MKTAFIIGNGTSRRDFDLKKIKKEHGITIGCNAAARDNSLWPDYIVAIDDGIIREIEMGSFPSNRCLFPPEDERYEPAECNSMRPRSNAGMNAMLEAIKMGATTLYCLGFDFLMIGTEGLDNMYKGTQNYGPETATSYADSIRRVKYLEYVATKNPEVNFVFVFKPGHAYKVINQQNIRGCFYEDFEKWLDRNAARRNN
jgi:hypothetical protein